MSLADITAFVTAPPKRVKFWRLSTVAVTVTALSAFLWLAQYVIDNGFLRRDIAALQAGEAWRTGGWLSHAVLRIVGLIPYTQVQQSVLSLTAAAATGLMFGILYHRMRANGWFVIGTVLTLVALGLHADVLYVTTAASRGLPLYFAFAALIPAIRGIEDVGDVQSAIGLGLLMPLLLLASPITTLLILPFALGAALAEPDGRRDPRAFFAMLLVAILPSLIVAVGIIGFIAQARLDVAAALLPYVATYGTLRFGDVGTSLLSLVTFAPVMVVPLAYCFWPRLPEKRHVFSALAVIVLPVYLAVARVILNTQMQAFVPAVALLAAFASWLAVVRLPMPLRLFALVMLGVSVILSWTVTGLWDDPLWKAALFNAVPGEVGNLSLRPGV
jgi:hypothetical protein